MALAFIVNPENKPQVNHKDGCRTNNMLSNLEWATAAENVQHGFDKNGRKIENLSSRKPINQLSISGQSIKKWDSLLKISKELGFDRSTIMKAIRKNRPYYGFYWQLAINKTS